MIMVTGSLKPFSASSKPSFLRVNSKILLRKVISVLINKIECIEMYRIWLARDVSVRGFGRNAKPPPTALFTQTLDSPLALRRRRSSGAILRELHSNPT